MRKKRTNEDDLNTQFREIYDAITINKLIYNGEEYQESDFDDSDLYVSIGGECLLTSYIKERELVTFELLRAVEQNKGQSSFAREIGKVGGKIGGITRRFLQECKIFVIHELFPESKFSGNALIEISNRLFGKGVSRTFLYSSGYTLGEEGIFNGKSDTVEVTETQKNQAILLIKLLKRLV